MTNPISPEEIRLLYQDQIDRISELKANQWRMSRYGLLIVASIFGVALTSALAGGHLSETLKIVLTIVAVVTAVGVLSLIHEFQGKTVHRRRALKILATLSDAPTGTFSEVRADLRERRQQPIGHFKRWSDDWIFQIVFFYMFALAVVAVCWVIYSA